MKPTEGDLRKSRLPKRERRSEATEVQRGQGKKGCKEERTGRQRKKEAEVTAAPAGEFEGS